MGHARPDALIVHGAGDAPPAPPLTVAQAKAALLDFARAAPGGHPVRDRVLGMAAGVFLTALVLPRRRTGRLLVSTLLDPRVLLVLPRLVPAIAALISNRGASARTRAGVVAPATFNGTEDTWPASPAVASDLGQPRSNAPYCDGAP